MRSSSVHSKLHKAFSFLVCLEFIERLVHHDTNPVNDACRVYVLEPPQYLVDEELNVVVGQFLRPHDVVEVCTHEMSHQVSETTNVC